jgi:hypothetical protein
MTALALFNRLREANFTFTKPCFENEKIISEKQKQSMNKLISCGLAQETSKNNYSLTSEGRIASFIGLEKWSKSITDIKRRETIYDCFGIFNNWYSLPRLKVTIEKISKLTILKQLCAVVVAVIIALVLYFIKTKFNFEI